MSVFVSSGSDESLPFNNASDHTRCSAQVMIASWRLYLGAALAVICATVLDFVALMSLMWGLSPDNLREAIELGLIWGAVAGSVIGMIVQSARSLSMVTFTRCMWLWWIGSSIAFLVHIGRSV